jgi:hypothetical protein
MTHQFTNQLITNKNPEKIHQLLQFFQNDYPELKEQGYGFIYILWRSEYHAGKLGHTFSPLSRFSQLNLIRDSNPELVNDHFLGDNDALVVWLVWGSEDKLIEAEFNSRIWLTLQYNLSNDGKISKERSKVVAYDTWFPQYAPDHLPYDIANDPDNGKTEWIQIPDLDAFKHLKKRVDHNFFVQNRKHETL